MLPSEQGGQTAVTDTMSIDRAIATYGIEPGPRIQAYAAALSRTRTAGGTLPNINDYLTADEQAQFAAFLNGGAPQGATLTPEQLAAIFGGSGSSGSGGVTFIGGSTPTPEPLPRTIEEAERWVRENYGWISWALDHPELGGILRTAALEGWPDDRVQSEIMGTDWWKNTTPAMRQWDELSARDPRAAWEQIEVRLADVERSAGLIGVELREGRAAEIVRDSLRMGWDQEDIIRAIVADAEWNGNPQGQLGDATSQILGRASEFGVNMSDRTAFEFAASLISGGIDQAGLDDIIKDQAKAIFPHLSDRIDQGVTPQTLAQPYLQSAAELLGLNPAEMDFMDPKWMRALSSSEGGETRVLTMDEWQKALVVDPQYGYDQSSHALNAATGFATELRRMFGYG